MQKKISFKSNKGYLLKGVLHIPSGKGLFPAVILLHGLSSNYEDKLIKSTALKLEKEGVIALRFSLSGHKPSGGSYKDITVSQFVKDVKNAINFLSKKSIVRKKRIAIMGHSIGGVTALLVASKFYKQLNSVVSVSAFVDVKLLIELNQEKGEINIGRDYFKLWDLKVTKKHFEDKLYKNNKKIISDIHLPILIIHGDKDKTVKVKDARTIYSLLEQPRGLKVIKGGNHNFTNSYHLDQLVDLTIKWFKKYLVDTDDSRISADSSRLPAGRQGLRTDDSQMAH